jgi:ribulose-bisphosphate carboxylase large chain
MSDDFVSSGLSGETLGPSLPNLLATVAGDLFELKPVTGLRLLDLRLPAAFAHAYSGPGFEDAGTRHLACPRDSL